MASPLRTPECRAEAIRIALTSSLSRKQVAADRGVGFSTLSRSIQHDQRCRRNVLQNHQSRAHLAAILANQTRC